MSAFEWSTLPRAERKQTSPLAYFLGFILALFIGILIFCYVVTKRANPVFVDVHGTPVSDKSQPPHH